LTYFKKKIGCAYDIGCAFQMTLHGTSLKQLVDLNQFLLMVGAFHSHAHNCSCQLWWHPTYIEGTGHTEGEGCEHVFSSSNELEVHIILAVFISIK
jgi:Kyakuja-Dileera-Zisupton transposase